MKLKLKITLVITFLVTITISIISITSIYVIRHKGAEDLVEFRDNEMAKSKDKLSNLVNLAVGVLDADYNFIKEVYLDSLQFYTLPLKGESTFVETALDTVADSSETVAADSSLLSMDLLSDTLNTNESEDIVSSNNNTADSISDIIKNAIKDSQLKKSLERISKLRFDNGVGYFWITDDNLPFPNVVMHSLIPQIVGNPLDVSFFNDEKNGENNYQDHMKVAMEKGEVFMEYTMNLTGVDTSFAKLAYFKHYEPLGYIISAGFSNDELKHKVALYEAEIDAQVHKMIFLIVVVGLIILGVSLLVGWRFSQNLINGINAVSARLNKLSQGGIVDEIQDLGKDELGKMAASLNDLVKGNHAYVSFAKDIGSGKFDSEFEKRSEEDVLGTELIRMRDNLIANVSENEIKSWSAEGLAIFANVLRKSNNDVSLLGDEIIKNLVKYLKINIGALFLVDEEAEDGLYLEMVACYAYDQKKFIRERIKVGEGHDLVGECFQEQETVNIKEVPDNYISIASGLGDTNPKNVILIPLMNNRRCHGVLEIASLKMLLDHEMEFVEKLSESIASTVEGVKMNARTKKLLEDSQSMAASLKEQEEELLQNQEEMAATQEEMMRSKSELEQENLQLKMELDQIRGAEGEDNGTKP